MTWKERRKLAYLMYSFDDINLKHSVVNINDDELCDMIIDFFKNESLLIYPAKSYFVAIVYAWYLKKYFNEDFYKSLNDPDLLPDDAYFVPYEKSKYVYDTVLKAIGNIEKYKSIDKTVSYFKQEMLIEEGDL